MFRARVGLLFVGLVATLPVIPLMGCAYALPPAVPASEDRVRIVAPAPEQYVVRIETQNTLEIPVPRDGIVTFNVPWYRRSCSVYLFGYIKVGGDSDPLQKWHVVVLHNGEPIRKVSLRELGNLNTDQAGYRLLRVHPKG